MAGVRQCDRHSCSPSCESHPKRTNEQFACRCNKDNTLCIWDTGTGKERRRFNVPNSSRDGRAFTNRLAVTADGATAALGNDDKSIRLIDLATGKERQRLLGTNEGVAGVAFTPDGRPLVPWHAAHNVTLWYLAPATTARPFSFAVP